MEQPRQQHYHFAYTVLPSNLFTVDFAALLLARYPDGFLVMLHALWERLGEGLPPGERASDEGMKLTAHRIGNLHPVVLVHMPPPERSLETYFLALVWTPALRYFTLGRSSSLPGECAESASATTLREVSPEANARIGSFFGPVPTVSRLLERLCDLYGLPAQIDALADDEVRALAAQVPIYPSPGPQALPERRTREVPTKPRKRWWEFWK
jgi:hypothetical protein